MAPLPYIYPDDSLWSWLAHDLRLYRERRSETQTQIGRVAGVTKQQVHNWESGYRKPDLDETRTLDRHWDTAGHFTRLRRFAEAGHDPDWFRSFLRYEKQAMKINSYTLSVIHGLLQTPDYARALLEAGGVDDVDAHVHARMARQEVLSRGLEFWALVNQSVLDQPVGGARVMRQQLAHVLEFSQRPKVVLRVVPRRVGAHVGLDGAFTIIRTRTETVAYVDAHKEGRLAQAGEDIEWYSLTFERIGADALNRDDSRALIKQVMEEMQ